MAARNANVTYPSIGFCIAPLLGSKYAVNLLQKQKGKRKVAGLVGHSAHTAHATHAAAHSAWRHRGHFAAAFNAD
jgi:hypothetical protein